MGIDFLHPSNRAVRILTYKCGILVDNSVFSSVSQACRVTKLPRKKITLSMDTGTGFSHKLNGDCGKYSAHDLTAQEITQLIERQREDARERAKLSGVGG